MLYEVTIRFEETTKGRAAIFGEITQRCKSLEECVLKEDMLGSLLGSIVGDGEKEFFVEVTTEEDGEYLDSDSAFVKIADGKVTDICNA